MEKEIDKSLIFLEEQYNYLQNNVEYLKGKIRKCYLSNDIIYDFLNSYIASMKVVFAFAKYTETKNSNSDYLKELTSTFHNDFNLYVVELRNYAVQKQCYLANKYGYIDEYLIQLTKKNSKKMGVKK